MPCTKKDATTGVCYRVIMNGILHYVTLLYHKQVIDKQANNYVSCLSQFYFCLTFQMCWIYGTIIGNHCRMIYCTCNGVYQLVLSAKRLQSLALYEIDLQLRKNGKSLSEFPSLPSLDHDLIQQCKNRLLYK